MHIQVCERAPGARTLRTGSSRHVPQNAWGMHVKTQISRSYASLPRKTLWARNLHFLGPTQVILLNIEAEVHRPRARGGHKAEASFLNTWGLLPHPQPPVGPSTRSDSSLGRQPSQVRAVCPAPGSPSLHCVGEHSGNNPQVSPGVFRGWGHLPHHPSPPKRQPPIPVPVPGRLPTPQTRPPSPVFLLSGGLSSLGRGRVPFTTKPLGPSPTPPIPPQLPLVTVVLLSSRSFQTHLNS